MAMTKNEIIDDVAKMVKKKFEGEPSGHDWWHIYRVWKLAEKIATEEKANIFIVELSALLHDFTDFKFCKNEKEELIKIRKMLLEYELEEKMIDDICEIITNVSYKGAKVKNCMKVKEGLIVQDADKLDATGAVGIARVFAFGGTRKRTIYDPAIKPKLADSFEMYKLNTNTSINHFYEKLLLLKNMMNTKTAKKIAKDRHLFMEKFLNKFYKEFEGKA